MRDNTYIMAFLIAAICMLVGGLTVTGLEIYQYSDAKYDSSSNSSQNSAKEQPERQSMPDSEELTSDTDTAQDAAE